MPHRAKLSGLPSWQPLRWIAPKTDATVTGIAAHGKSLVFRAQGGGRKHGIYVEEPGSEMFLLLEDDAQWRYFDPRSAGEYLAVEAARARDHAPRIREIVFVSPSSTLRVPGQSVGMSADGRVAVVADLDGKRLRRVDLVAGTHDEVAPLDAGMDALLAPPVTVNADGTQVLVMDARTEQADASLELVELSSGKKTRLLGPLPEPSRCAGAFSPDGQTMVAAEFRVGEPSSFKLWLVPRGQAMREALSFEHAQPFARPVFLDEQMVAVMLSPVPHPVASYGATDLYAMRIDGGAPVPMTKEGNLQGRLRVDGAALLVEGGHALGRIELLPPRA